MRSARGMAPRGRARAGIAQRAAAQHPTVPQGRCGGRGTPCPHSRWPRRLSGPPHHGLERRWRGGPRRARPRRRTNRSIRALAHRSRRPQPIATLRRLEWSLRRGRGWRRALRPRPTVSVRPCGHRGAVRRPPAARRPPRRTRACRRTPHLAAVLLPRAARHGAILAPRESGARRDRPRPPSARNRSQARWHRRDPRRPRRDRRDSGRATPTRRAQSRSARRSRGNSRRAPLRA